MQYLPDLYRYAVEVRHDAYFSGDLGRRFIDLLSALNFDLVIYDTRALRSAAATDPVVKRAQRQKPDLPARFMATGAHPFIRLALWDFA